MTAMQDQSTLMGARTSQTRAMTRNANASYAMSFVFSMLMASLVPVIPLLALRMGASLFEIGIIGSASCLTYVPVALLSGALSERFNKRRLLMISSFLYAVACTAYWMSSTPLHLMLSKLLDGLSTAILWPAVEALLADSARISGDRLISNFGVLWSSGSIAGGLISSVVLWYGNYEVVFLPCAATSLLMCCLSALMVSKRIDPQVESKRKSKDGSVSPKKMIQTWSIAALYAFCQGTIFSLYPPYALLRGIPGALIGLTIALLVAGRTLMFYLYRFVKRSFRALALVGSFVAFLLPLLLMSSIDPLVLLSCGFLLGTGLGLCYSAAIRSALEADPSSRGMYAGVFESSIGVGYLLGSGIGGVASEFVLEGPYIVSSAVALSVLALLLGRPRETESHG